MGKKNKHLTLVSNSAKWESQCFWRSPGHQQLGACYWKTHAALNQQESIPLVSVCSEYQQITR